MNLHDLEVGQRFRFEDKTQEYVYRGNGWYATVNGYDGGPWHGLERLQGNPVVACEEVVAVLLVGAEGVSELRDAPWLRDATAEETALYHAEHNNPSYIDTSGRPYWLKAVVEHPELPDVVRDRARGYVRCVRLTD